MKPDGRFNGWTFDEILKCGLQIKKNIGLISEHVRFKKTGYKIRKKRVNVWDLKGLVTD